jgi:hypothetical protein
LTIVPALSPELFASLLPQAAAGRPADNGHGWHASPVVFVLMLDAQDRVRPPGQWDARPGAGRSWLI